MASEADAVTGQARGSAEVKIRIGAASAPTLPIVPPAAAARERLVATELEALRRLPAIAVVPVLAVAAEAVAVAVLAVAVAVVVAVAPAEAVAAVVAVAPAAAAAVVVVAAEAAVGADDSGGRNVHTHATQFHCRNVTQV